ncbi:MAG: UDP-N-acetylmuramoyl-L-alanine--D-glutamate ligase [Candidatus Saccharibacteria bacterium]|nr:UDP-N-acetylmuramoyl-L-alanine--D-glutamate ligase [Candidatus Saccharibacteria bacterium]
MKIAILGYDRQGRSAYDYWGPGNEITICDRNPETVIPEGAESHLGEAYLDDLDDFHLIIRTPGLHPKQIVEANNERILRKVTTVTEEFFRVCPAPIIGVTGTKGKGTTSSLIAAILEQAGKTVHLGGNIGIAPLDMLKDGIKSDDWVVLELANFQLIDLGVSPTIAVCLMVVPEHLDWHTDMAEYIGAKQQLFRNQGPKDRAIFNRLSDFSGEVVEVSSAFKISYEVPPVGQIPGDKNGAYVLGDDIYMDDEKVCKTSDVALLGRHNLENVCAAIAAIWDVIDNDASVIVEAVKKFKGLPHRLDLVREVNNVKYYDDSFGTTPETAIVAIESIAGKKVLILGGSEKKSDYSELEGIIAKSDVHTLITIGVTGSRIASEAVAAGFNGEVLDGGTTMQSIVATASRVARPGDSVLLSTACASFGMFKDYIERGEQFKAEVAKL